MLVFIHLTLLLLLGFIFNLILYAYKARDILNICSTDRRVSCFVNWSIQLMLTLGQCQTREKNERHEEMRDPKKGEEKNKMNGRGEN